MDKPIIKLEHITKDFYVFKSNHQKTKAILFGMNAGICRRALEDINLEIMPGENIGIVGSAGSGRTTLLKIIAGITTPTAGNVTVNAKPNVMLNPKSGLELGLSGRTNISIKASLLGWSKAQIREHSDELIAFAEIEKYADLPVKSYAPGMAARLGFAIQTCFPSELFIMDDSLSVGNAAHKNKCYAKLEEYVNNPETTFLMVSSAPATLKRFCQRAIVLHEGKIVFDGAPGDAVSYYRKNCRSVSKEVSEEEEMNNVAIDLMRENSEEETEEYGL